MNESINAKFMKLESDLSALKKLVLGKADAGKAAKPEPEIADDDLLDREWADMLIRKDPPKAKESFAGRKMSECTPSYLRGYASFHEWKAQKGREETPVRLNAKGKPWHESDSLVAKVARGWARRIEEGYVVAPKAAHGAAEDDDTPF